MDCYNKAIKYLTDKYGKSPTYILKDEWKDETDILIYILITEWSLSRQSQKELCEIINLKFIPKLKKDESNT